MGDWEPAEDVILHEQEGEAFLLHVPSGRYFGLNETGLVVWKAVLAGQDPAQELGRRWPDVSVDDRQTDVDSLVQALVAAGLIHARGSPSGAAGRS